MCINKRNIKNPYTGQRLYVSCGKCPACMQQKADKRAARIRANHSDDCIDYFVTLTYANIFCPYVKRDELNAFNLDVNVYRDASIRKNRKGKTYNFISSISRKTEILTKVDYAYVKESDLAKVQGLRNYDKDKIGVVLYSDIQRFFKRLRVNARRKFGCKGEITYFSCAEYGPKTSRPHFHAIISVPRTEAQLWYTAIIESWPYDSAERKLKGVQIARNASSYVSSYVNSHTNFSPLYSQKCFKTKHSYSHSFGLADKVYSFDSVLEMSNKRDFVYQRAITTNGAFGVVDMSVPKYVINKYFPIFQGYSRCDGNTLLELLSNPTPANCAKYYGHYYRSINRSTTLIDLEDISNALSVKLTNWLTSMRHRGYLPTDAALLHLQTHKAYKSSMIKHQYDAVKSLDDFAEVYDNTSCLVWHPEISPTLSGVNIKEYDPNKYESNMSEHNHYMERWHYYDKSRKLNNAVMSTQLKLHV